MAEFEISGPARRDLREIYDWIAQDDPAAADQVLSDLRDAIVRLAEMPGLGHVREDLADESLRVWTVHRYVVIYQPERTPMLVVRVLSGYPTSVPSSRETAQHRASGRPKLPVEDRRISVRSRLASRERACRQSCLRAGRLAA